MTQLFPHSTLRDWFLDERRDFPWRESPTPYAVWVSEVMLQQTQASVVVPYFTRWMEAFPTISALAEADLDVVIKVWEGLGYYSRARNLHEAAKFLVERHGGELPRSELELSRIKGLGPYTVGAIRSFAFHEKAAAVDGNVLRVLARYYGIHDDISKSSTQKNIRELTQQLLPDAEPWVCMEALIELGARVCTRKAQCRECPLRPSCKAFSESLVEMLPVKGNRINYEALYRAVAVIEHGDKILLRRGKKGQIMSDLYEFPYFETTARGMTQKALAKRIHDDLGLEAEKVCALPETQQSFTKYRVRLRPVLFQCAQRNNVPGMQWVAQSELENLAFSSGHKRILREWSREHAHFTH